MDFVICIYKYSVMLHKITTLLKKEVIREDKRSKYVAAENIRYLWWKHYLMKGLSSSKATDRPNNVQELLTLKDVITLMDPFLYGYTKIARHETLSVVGPLLHTDSMHNWGPVASPESHQCGGVANTNEIVFRRSYGKDGG